jgi:hypothetical protein
LIGAMAWWVAAIAHAQTRAESAAPIADDLRNFIAAYLVGFAACAAWLGVAAFWQVRRDARGLRR